MNYCVRFYDKPFDIYCYISFSTGTVQYPAQAAALKSYQKFSVESTSRLKSLGPLVLGSVPSM